MKTVVRLFFIILIPVIATIIWMAPSDPVRIEPLSKAALEEIEARKILYKKKKTEECRLHAIETAARMVDSALLEQALFIGADTLVRPFRPDRPFAETFTSNIEHIPVRPWLKKSDFVSPFQKKDTFALDSLKKRDSLILKKTEPGKK